MITPATHCRLSGEPLADAVVLFELPAAPFPGVYPTTPDEARALRTPLRVVQARASGFVQLGHQYASSWYEHYAFAGGTGAAYRAHLTQFAAEIAARYPRDASILEVGCGDGWLVRHLRGLGFTAVHGIDPSRAARAQAEPWILSGYFPQDLPAELRQRPFDLIVTRHVLEHIETPRPFLASLAAALAPAGELWIEVPDLASTVERQLWSNFYQLHCGYYAADTLDALAATAGLRCHAGTIVEIFGGSLLRKYRRAEDGGRTAEGGGRGTEDGGQRAEDRFSAPAQISNFKSQIPGVIAGVAAFQAQLARLAESLPPGTVGYGAAERTAATLGHGPALTGKLRRLFDGNPLLSGRYLAGTELRIESKEALFRDGAPAIVLFALSNAAEILEEWRRYLRPETLVSVVGRDSGLQPLGQRRIG